MFLDLKLNILFIFIDLTFTVSDFEGWTLLKEVIFLFTVKAKLKPTLGTYSKILIQINLCWGLRTGLERTPSEIRHSFNGLVY